MRQWPIWIDVQACTYKNSKSYGAKDTNEQTILVGSSKTNSHELCKIMNYKRFYEEYKGHKEVVVFKTKVDNYLIKEIIFKDNKGRAGEKLETLSYLGAK